MVGAGYFFVVLAELNCVGFKSGGRHGAHVPFCVYVWHLCFILKTCPHDGNILFLPGNLFEMQCIVAILQWERQ
jgi:hypothetical protein